MQRKLKFYRLVSADGRDLASQFPAQTAVRRLQEIAATESDGDAETVREFLGQNEMRLLAEGVCTDPFPSLALYRRRVTNLPRLATGGRVTSLSLAQGQSLAEITFMTFLPRNIVSVVYNHEGPRANRLAEYFNAKFASYVKLVPVVRDDLAQVLDSLTLSALTVSIPSTLVGSLAQGDDWVESLDTASRLVNDGAVTLRIGVGRTGTAAQKQSKRARLRELMDQLRSRGDLDHFNSAKASGRTPGSNVVAPFDLLEEKFVMRVEIPDEESQAVPNAFASMRDVASSQWEANRAYLERVTPECGAVDENLISEFIENPPQ